MNRPVPHAHRRRLSASEYKDKSAVLPYGILVLNSSQVTRTQRGVRQYFYSVCLLGNQTKLEIIPSRKLTVFEDVIMNVHNRHKEIKYRVRLGDVITAGENGGKTQN